MKQTQFIFSFHCITEYYSQAFEISIKKQHSLPSSRSQALAHICQQRISHRLFLSLWWEYEIHLLALEVSSPACSMAPPVCGWTHPTKALSKLQGRNLLFFKAKSFFLPKVKQRSETEEENLVCYLTFECACVHVCIVCAHVLLNSDLGLFQGNDLEEKVHLTIQ